MDTVFLLLAGAGATIMGLHFLAFLGMMALFLGFVLYSLSGREESWGWATLWLIILGVLAYTRFSVPWWSLLVGLVGWVICGVLYARYVRWDRQLDKLKIRIVEAFKNSRIIGAGEQEKPYRRDRSMPSDSDQNTEWKIVEPDLGGCELRPLDGRISAQMKSDEANLDTVLKQFKPKFEQNRRRVTSWIILWGIYVLKDLTIDLIDNILDAMKTSFTEKADKTFSA